MIEQDTRKCIVLRGTLENSLDPALVKYSQFFYRSELGRYLRDI